MKEQLISHKTAVLAKEVGFNIITPFYYNCENPLSDSCKIKRKGWITYETWGDIESGVDEETGLSLYKLDAGCVYAPTQSLLQKWLRDVHGIVVDLNCLHKNHRKQISYTYNIISFNDKLSGRDGALKKIHNLRGNSEMSYEEALEEGLFQALKLVKDE